MNWLKDDAIYLPSHIAEDLKRELLELSYLAETNPNSETEREYKGHLILLKIYGLMDLLVFHAIDGIPKDIEEEMEELEVNMLCVHQGGGAYTKQRSLGPKVSKAVLDAAIKTGCCAAAK